MHHTSLEPSACVAIHQSCHLFTIIFLSLFIYFERERERDRAHEQGRGGKRGWWERIQAGSLCTTSTEPDMGLKTRTARSWPEPKSRAGHLTDWATQAPLAIYHQWRCDPTLRFPKFTSTVMPLASQPLPKYTKQASTESSLRLLTCFMQ